MRQLIIAEPHGFCAGVQRALAIVERALAANGPPIYVRNEIVHNQHVVADLRRRGVIFVEAEDEVPSGAVCVFSAHGVAPSVHANASRRGLQVIDATCPLVSKVHAEVRRFDLADRTVVLIGHRGHEEVEGTLGHASSRTVVVGSSDDVARLDLAADTRIGIATQTTLAIEEVSGIVEALKARYADVVEPAVSDVCFASSNRQAGVRALVERCDLVLVVGSRNSSNSVQLVEVAHHGGRRGHLVPDVSELDAAWLVGVGTVGLTSGASAPESVFDAVVARLVAEGFSKIELLRVADELVAFGLPGVPTPSEG